MAGENRLARNIRELMGGGTVTIYQGEVVKVEEKTCAVRFGSQTVDGIRLRASLTDRDRQCIAVPKVGSAVIVGSLSGDLSELVVLQVDEVESIEVNGGKLGGLININDLTGKLNKLVNEVNMLKSQFNGHTHTGTIEGTSPSGPVSGTCTCIAPGTKANDITSFDSSDFEDTTVTH